ncbi:hypothetical protein YC2023_026163 [Brassica napus]
MAVSFPRLPRWLCGGGGGSTKKDSKGSSPSLKKTIKTGSSSSVKKMKEDGLIEERRRVRWGMCCSLNQMILSGPLVGEDDTGGGFVVLVPCYKKVIDGSGNQIPTGFLSPASDKKNMEQWLSSMGKL